VVARLPRRLFVHTALLLGLSLAHSSFVYVPADGDAGVLRALHPVNALLLFWLGLHLARGAVRLPERDVAIARHRGGVSGDGGDRLG
jgi:hypothetical protein